VKVINSSIEMTKGWVYNHCTIFTRFKSTVGVIEIAPLAANVTNLSEAKLLLKIKNLDF